MKGVFSAPGDYVYFKSQVPLHKIPIGTKQWRYYDFGPKVVPPLICLPGIAGTSDVYYKQIMALSLKGYRVISVDIPCVWNHHEWIQAFEKFLDVIDVHHIHLYGTSLGGFLAQLFAQHRPRRVRSLILSNTFLETRSFAAAMPWAPVVSWTPSFLLKRYVLTGIRNGPHEPFIADSLDFVVSQVETLSKDELASRLTLNVDAASVGSLLLSDSFITIMDTNDYCAIPQQLKDQLSERYPEARRAQLKTGGDFPFLSRSDEVNLHLQLHLRRVGVEARPDLVRGIPKDGTGGSYSESEDGKGDQDDQSKDNRGNLESPSRESELSPAPEGSESHGLDEQLLINAKYSFSGQQDRLRLCELLSKQQNIASELLSRFTVEISLQCLLFTCVGSLYIISKLFPEPLENCCKVDICTAVHVVV
ncbi:ACID CLUSTER PROTEIN 33 [Salix viminalis]|uniref:Maspardin n=2 Tax=Salix TaxID=40685 RepID=A0A9Q0TIJ7_SALPP|nr:ACID CLUSTER PROTEIN 33 [Salix purpurea]KAJ6714603.1 ACID CLUSTER PROTEIN 33 [Salix viminalis]